MLNQIKQFFNIDDSYAVYNLTQAAIFVLRNNIDDEVIQNILDLSKINMSTIEFLRLLENSVKNKNDYKDNAYLKKMNRSPPALKIPITWIYYALFWSLDLMENCPKSLSKEIPYQIGKIALTYHYLMLKMKENENINFVQNKYGDEFYEDLSRSAVRIIEIMIAFINRDDAYLKETYLNEGIDDWIENFLEIITEDPIESESLYIQKNDKKGENYFLYENSYIDVEKFHIISSRRIKGGNSRTHGRNRNIIVYFTTEKEKYKTLKSLKTKKSSDEKGGWSRGYELSQFTVVEPLLINTKKVYKTIDLEHKHEEQIEEASKLKIQRRAFPIEGNEHNISNTIQQKKRNIAFSATITKKTLLLSTDYEVPAIEHLMEFLVFMFDSEISNKFERKDLFKVVFLTSVLTGLEYNSVLNIIIFEKDNRATYNIGANNIKLGIDHTLFAKSNKKSEFTINSSMLISYNLPHLFWMLIARIRNLITAYGEDISEEMCNDESFNKYKNYIKEYTEKFPKMITINVNQLWRISATYRRKTLLEDMSMLFCISKHQTNDRPRLAYTATLNNSHAYSDILEKLYTDLNIQHSVATLLNISPVLFQPKLKSSSEKKYSGSSLAVTSTQSVLFFKKLRNLILLADNNVKQFNLHSIYIRYALSLLLGTRSFTHSDNFEQISYELHVLLTSEKSTTLLSGIRAIPLCGVAESLIQRYIELGISMNMELTEVMLLRNNELTNFKNKTAVLLLQEYKAEQWVIDFVQRVSINTGRHVITKYAIEHNFNSFFLETFLGHYISGGEQLGIFSSLNIQDYIKEVRQLTSNIANIYGVEII